MSPSHGECSMPTFMLQLPGEIAFHEVVADDLVLAKKKLRDKLKLKRLPAGVQVIESSVPNAEVAAQLLRENEKAPKTAMAKKPSWKDLPPGEKLQHLLKTPTIPDKAHTDRKREKGESR